MTLIWKVLLGIYIYLIVGFAVYMFSMLICLKYPDSWFAPFEWGYVVQKMKEKYGICVESSEKFSFGELMLYMNRIWDDFFITKFEEENKNV